MKAGAKSLLRQRFAYFLMSVFLAWHAMALVLAPAPESVATDWLRRLFQPYLTLLRLDNQWDFFAPVVGDGSRFRYDIEDKMGRTHTFFPADELNWLHPNYFWFRSWHYRIIQNPNVYADYAATYFCRKHRTMEPAAITLFEVKEETFTREDFLSGYDRMHPDFLTANELRRFKCPSG